MTAFNQDFDLYAGDDEAPIFTVTDGSGNAINLSTASEIEWFCYKDKSLAAALKKFKSTGGVTFVTTGIDGKIYVNISNVDSAPLDGWYFHSAIVTDANGNKTTFEVGRLAVLQHGPA